MRHCTNCGGAIREGAKFCTTCGTRQNDLDTAGQNDVWAPSTDPNSEPTTVTNPAPDAGPDYVRLDIPSTATASNEATSGGFSWSWGTDNTAGESASTDDLEQQLDETLGNTNESDESAESHAGTHSPAPDPVSEDLEDVIEPDREAREDDIDSEVDSAEVLAGFSGGWLDTDDSAPETAPATGPSSDSVEDAQPENDDGEEEDTVAKAERLIAELRSIIPSLARPRPVDPERSGGRQGVTYDAGSLLHGLLDELDDAEAGTSFDDLREILSKARENPRDVDTMLGLAGQTERLVELLDDRDRLAHRLDTLANRLRGIPHENDREV